MILSRKFAAVPFASLAAAILVAALAGMAALCVQAQMPRVASNLVPPPASVPGTAMNPNLVVLDPAHGGSDAGATLGNNLFEKDVTLALALRLRTALTVEGFTVVMTRQSDSVSPPAASATTANLLTNDQRAGIANHAHALACLVIHATPSGSGVHLYTSQLQPQQQDADYSFAPPSAFHPVLWDSAQAGFVSQSLLLADGLRATLVAANFPVVVGRQSVQPLDNLMCPAVAIELAPQLSSDGNTTSVADVNYQQRVATTLAAALSAWRSQQSSSSPQAPSTASGGLQPTAPAAAAKAAEQAAAEARAAAEASGREAVRLANAREAKARAAARAAKGASGAAGAHPAQTGGGE